MESTQVDLKNGGILARPLLPQNFGLPPEISQLIDESVKRFEDQWGLMKAYAKQNGWLEKYRQEITEVVKKAYQEGQKDIAGRQI